jgi:hypothetical protein
MDMNSIKISETFAYFYLEEGGGLLLRNTATFVPEYTVLSWRPQLNIHSLENFSELLQKNPRCFRESDVLLLAQRSTTGGTIENFVNTETC